MSRLGNGIGSVYKLSGNRKNPWVARKTVGFDMRGYPQYRYIGYYRTKADAMTALMDYNKTPYSLEKIPLFDIYDKFLDNYENHHNEKTVKNIKTCWDHLFALHNIPITSLNRRLIQESFDALPVTSQVKRKCKGLLRQLFDCAIKYDYITPERKAILDYIDLESNIAVRKIDRDRFSDEEIARLYKINDDMAHILLFLIYTGLRSGEFCNLTEDDIDKDMVLSIRRAKTQTGIRTVPLSDKAIKLIPLPQIKSYNTLKCKFDLWKKEYGFDRTLHCTRYTTISLLTSAGVDDRIIRAIVGHKARNVTEAVYTKISIEDKRTALNKI